MPEDAHRGLDIDHRIMRTVEMESWSESRAAGRDKMGHGFDPAEDSLELKNDGVIYTSAASDKSSGSLPRDTVAPFADRRDH